MSDREGELSSMDDVGFYRGKWEREEESKEMGSLGSRLL